MKKRGGRGFHAELAFIGVFSPENDSMETSQTSNTFLTLIVFVHNARALKGQLRRHDIKLIKKYHSPKVNRELLASGLDPVWPLSSLVLTESFHLHISSHEPSTV